MPTLGHTAMMLGLMLFYAGCAHTPRLAPSVTQTTLGNAVLMQLPPGTTLEFTAQADRDLARSLFANETEVRGPAGAALKIVSALRLATPAYIIERDQREIHLLLELEKLWLENQRLRAK